MIRVVRVVFKSSKAAVRSFSVPLSSALDASSRIKMGASRRTARAMLRRWRSPPLRARPRSPMRVSNPLSLASMKDRAWARTAAAWSSSSVAVILPTTMFSWGAECSQSAECRLQTECRQSAECRVIGMWLLGGNDERE
jgi:hypothetical protein